MTYGERRLAQRLQDKLSSDTLIWHNVPVGDQQLHPDFIVVSPKHGLLVLEVKDWKLDTIQQVTPDTFTLVTSRGTTDAKNPLEQAWDYLMAIAHMLQADPQLTQTTPAYQGKLAFPYSHGVVLTNITRKQFNAQPALAQVLPPRLVLCQDEMYASVDAQAFQERLWAMHKHSFGDGLTTEQIDRVRAILFPDLRIAQQLSLLPDSADDAPIQVHDLMQVMDIQQEQLARSLGDGHRVIHGVAGSGKTMILGYRCLHLAKHTTKPILVLCYNVALATLLRQRLQANGAPDHVEVRSFHKWCRDLLLHHQQPLPDSRQHQGDEYCRELVRLVTEAIEQGHIPSGHYGAILIDEGHDFDPEWFTLIVQMLDPDTQSLLLLYDDAQSIYDKQQGQPFSFKSVGIQAQGRTTILKLNYRNTVEILATAAEFAQDILTAADPADDDIPVRLKPQSAGRSGSLPRLFCLSSLDEEITHLAQHVQNLHADGIPWNDIGILYRSRPLAQRIFDSFHTAGIPIEWVNRDTTTRLYDPHNPTIKLVTLHSSKGLEFPVVLIPGLGDMPHCSGTPEQEARLLYIGMTRATDRLILTGHQRSDFVQRLETVLAKLYTLIPLSTPPYGSQPD